MYIEYNKDKQIKSIMFGNIKLLNSTEEYISANSLEEVSDPPPNYCYITEHTQDSPIKLELL